MWEKECISKPFFVFQLSPPGVMLCIHRTLPEVINQGTVERMHAGRNTALLEVSTGLKYASGRAKKIL